MRVEQEMVRQFQLAFDHPIAKAPTYMQPARVEQRARWLYEEANEFENATNLEEQVDAIVDLIYFALGTMVELGVEAAPVFHIVHQANMGKLWADGRPRFRDDDGKVVKPSSWKDPAELVTQEIRRQMCSPVESVSEPQTA